DYALNIFGRVGRPGWISCRAFPVIGWTINVFAPFGHVAIKIKNPKSVGFFLAPRVRLLLGILSEPCILSKLVRLPKVIRKLGPGVTGVFPFSLSRESITVGCEITVPISSFFIVANFQSFQQ